MQNNAAFSRRRFLGLTAGTMAVGLIAACGPASSTPTATTAPAAGTKPVSATAPAVAGQPKKGGTLNYAEVGDFNNFNPWALSAVNMGAYDQVFSRLIYKDDKGEVHNDLAESATMAPDAMSFTAKLKPGIKWHDGRDLQAEDFATMFGYMRDASLSKDPSVSKMATLTQPMKGVRTPDKSTVVFEFNSPMPYFVDVLDYWYAVRIDDPSDAAFMNKPPVGTGPLKLTNYAPKQYTQFVRNDAYYQGGLPLLDGWMFKRLDKAETLVPNLDSGAVDGIFGVPASDVARLQKDDKYQVDISAARGGAHVVLINTKIPPFDKRDVRQALFYSLNREAMAKNAFFGISQPLSSVFFSPTSLAYREDLTHANGFDLDKASSLLKQAGVSNLSMDIHPTAAFPQMKLYSLIWQADLAKIGVKLNVQEVESAKFYDIGGDANLQGNVIHPWTVGRATRDPAVFLSANWAYRGGETNKYGWKNDEVEQLFTQAAGEPDEAKRRADYQRVNEIVTTELPVLQVATDPQVWVWNKAVKDLHYTLLGLFMLDKAWLDR